MIRLRLPELMEEQTPPWTTYRLAKELGYTEPSIYRLVRRKGQFQRLDAALLERLCLKFDKPPGEIIEWIPEYQHQSGHKQSRKVRNGRQSGGRQNK
jgi:DNA-binding Xre family transcriptional regulator